MPITYGGSRGIWKCLGSYGLANMDVPSLLKSV